MDASKKNKILDFGLLFLMPVIIFSLLIGLLYAIDASSAKPKKLATKVEQTQASSFNCAKDVETEKMDQAYVDCLKIDKKNLMVILDDKKIDKKEAALLQRVMQKINKEYDKMSEVNILNSNDRDFIKQLELFDDKGYTEIINARYKATVDLFFSEWIESEQEYVDFS